MFLLIDIAGALLSNNITRYTLHIFTVQYQDSIIYFDIVGRVPCYDEYFKEDKSQWRLMNVWLQIMLNGLL